MLLKVILLCLLPAEPGLVISLQTRDFAKEDGEMNFVNSTEIKTVNVTKGSNSNVTTSSYFVEEDVEMKLVSVSNLTNSPHFVKEAGEMNVTNFTEMKIVNVTKDISSNLTVIPHFNEERGQTNFIIVNNRTFLPHFVKEDAEMNVTNSTEIKIVNMTKDISSNLTVLPHFNEERGQTKLIIINNRTVLPHYVKDFGKMKVTNFTEMTFVNSRNPTVLPHFVEEDDKIKSVNLTKGNRNRTSSTNFAEGDGEMKIVSVTKGNGNLTSEDLIGISVIEAPPNCPEDEEFINGRCRELFND